MTRPRVYAAHPIVTYGTARERDCLASLRTVLPGVDLYDRAGRYSTDAGWLRAWPRVLSTISGLVVFGTREWCRRDRLPSRDCRSFSDRTSYRHARPPLPFPRLRRARTPAPGADATAGRSARPG